MSSDGQRLRDEVGASVQRRREVHREHPVAAVADEDLGGDERGEQQDRGGDEAVVARVVGDLVRVEDVADDDRQIPTNTIAGM